MASEHNVEELYAQQLAALRAGTVIRGDSLSSQDCLAHVSNFRDKVVLITGASSGFGRATALVAARHGAKLVLGDLNEAGVKKVVEEVKRNGGQAIARSCNVTSFESQRDLFEAGEKEFGWIDIVVPNAGVTEKLHPGFEDSVTDKAGRLQPPNLITLDVNLRGAVFTTHLALHYLRKRPDRTGKALVMIGSMASFFSIPSGPMYSVAKSGILGLMRSEYFTLNASGIRTAMVAPWYTETGIIEPLTRLAIIGLPMSEISDVVDAIVCAATHPAQDGRSLIVDPKGVFSIPFEARVIGNETIYDQFAQRAISPIRMKAVVSDTIKLLRIKYGRSLLAIPFVTILALFGLRRRRQKVPASGL